MFVEVYTGKHDDLISNFKTAIAELEDERKISIEC